jgi:hypothetical protein
LSKTATRVVNKHHGVPYDVYIGRGSKWGNPFTHMDDTTATYRVGSRDEAISRYLDWIFEQRELLADLHQLRGKVLGCYCFPAPCHGEVLARLADTSRWVDDKIILECSTLGDVHYSAFGAEVEIFGKKTTIEEHYQLSKRFIGPNRKVFVPKHIYDVKGKHSKTKDMEFAWITVGEHIFPPSMRLEFYKWMWLKYLDENPKLVAYASHFDDYNDIFKGKSIICQADCIRQYIQTGRESIVDEVKEFVELIGGDI